MLIYKKRTYDFQTPLTHGQCEPTTGAVSASVQPKKCSESTCGSANPDIHVCSNKIVWLEIFVFHVGSSTFILACLKNIAETLYSLK